MMLHLHRQVARPPPTSRPRGSLFGRCCRRRCSDSGLPFGFGLPENPSLAGGKPASSAPVLRLRYNRVLSFISGQNRPRNGPLLPNELVVGAAAERTGAPWFTQRQAET